MSHARLRLTGLSAAVAAVPDDPSELYAALSGVTNPAQPAPSSTGEQRTGRIWLAVNMR